MDVLHPTHVLKEALGLKVEYQVVTVLEEETGGNHVIGKGKAGAVSPK